MIGSEPVDIEAIAIMEVSGDFAEPSPHRHTEGFYVLEGELALTAGDRELLAEAGSWVQVPPGVPRRVTMPARHLNVRAPGPPA